MSESPDHAAPEGELPPPSEPDGLDASFNDFDAVSVRYRDPARYGKWLDRYEVRQTQEGPAMIFGYRILRLMRAAWTAFEVALRGSPPPLPEPERLSSLPEEGGDGGWR